MTRVGHILYRSAVTVCLLLCISVSCSKVPFSAPVTDDEVPLAFDVDWSKVTFQGEEPPKKITVMMTKAKTVVRHLVWDVDKDGNILNGQMLETGEPAVETISSGTYVVSGFSTYESDSCFVSGVEAFKENGGVRMKDVSVRIPDLTAEEVDSLNIRDFNTASRYLRSISPFYYLKDNDNGTRILPSEGGVKLIFEPLTCRLNFSVNVSAEVGVQLERVVGVISGLPVRAYVMSGQVEADTTGKMLFPMEVDGTPSSEYTKNNENDDVEVVKARYVGSLNTFGIIPPDDNKLRTGEGILNIIVVAKLTEPQEDGKGDVVYDRVFNAAFNMKKLIESSGVMTRVNDYSELYNLKRFSCDFYMNNTLEIFREMVKTDNESGFETWNEEDCGDDKGMNQEI